MTISTGKPVRKDIEGLEYVYKAWMVIVHYIFCFFVFRACCMAHDILLPK